MAWCVHHAISETLRAVRAQRDWVAVKPTRRLWHAVLASTALAASLCACGGGGGGGSGGGDGNGGAGSGGVMWPDRGGGTSTELPPTVVTGRIVFRSQSGESCCVAVDPNLLSGSAGQALVVLDDLPVGPATVTIAGFSTEFAPAVADVADTCTTIPATAGTPCDPVRVAAPAFESAPLSVNIIAGSQTNVGTIDISAMPFLLDFSPAQGESVAPPVGFAFTVVDAVTSIRADSVNLEVTFQREEGDPPVFRAITKRVPISLTECDDGSALPCSPEGNLDLVGFKAAGTAPELPEGEVEAHITAENLADPPRDLDFRYPFIVLATPEPSPTATATAVSAPAEGSSEPAAAPSAPARGVALTPTPTATPTPGRGGDAR